MTDSDPPETPLGGPKVLGRVSLGDHDTTLAQPGEGAGLPPLRLPPPVSDEPRSGRQVEPRSHRRAAADDEHRTTLPRGALAALHRSGGFAFRTTSVTVYRDGRVTHDVDGPGGERAQVVWVLADAELDALREAIAAVDWAALRFAHARQSPDAYAYELLARDGRRLRRLETAEGAIPEQVEPLIRRLAGYAASEG
jgi:hypothetical protein